jgi:hypothetical protein
MEIFYPDFCLANYSTNEEGFSTGKRMIKFGEGFFSNSRVPPNWFTRIVISCKPEVSSFSISISSGDGFPLFERLRE